MGRKPNPNLTNAEHLRHLYENQGKSTYEIGKMLNVSNVAVKEALVRFNIKLRSKAEAQKLALDSGRINHPTKGKQRSAEEKYKISESKARSWEQMSEEDQVVARKKLSDSARKKWENSTEEEKEKIKKAIFKGLYKSSREGSSLERYLYAELVNNGFYVEYHIKELLADPNLEVDMWLPKEKVVIEIDGPSHYVPIWGDEKLQKNQKAMNKKNGLVLGYGLVMIRVKNLRSKLSQKNLRDISLKIVDYLKNLRKKFPEPGKRLIELEI